MNRIFVAALPNCKHVGQFSGDDCPPVSPKEALYLTVIAKDQAIMNGGRVNW